MTAFRPKNLRSGDLAEQLGLLLLQNMTLIAPIPRTEDVGIDAVVTLLEEFDSQRLKASNSFYVQLKSTSVKEVIYKGDQVEWLLSLELPFFIAEVDRAKTRIDLYCCHALNEAFISNRRRPQLKITFEDGILLDDFHQDKEIVKVGPPVFSWTINDLESVPDLRVKFNEVIKGHIEFYKRSMEERRVGSITSIEWVANFPPKWAGGKSIELIDDKDPVRTASDLAMPYFLALIDACVRHKNDYWLDELLVFVQRARRERFWAKGGIDSENPGPNEDFNFLENWEREQKNLKEKSITIDGQEGDEVLDNTKAQHT
ncbi:hypothetical protein K5D34_08195 [Pseudomonas cichorii]|nr:hypothetical protein [Pseudomonas cichorii]MBX8509651.1 hypothetical protein [Pseudomonas cichorii]MBX8524872.1 hypothetical protein [Pseudomonas cichorii]MBX8564223.1 hypothetical protein [Pseudomonas cichorii]